MALEILETPRGRNSLASLGQSLVSLWRLHQDPRFSGGYNQMLVHVDHFLRALRADFPYVVIDGPAAPMAACYRDMGPWTGNIYDYQPKAAVLIHLSHFVNFTTSLIYITAIACLFSH
jgi:hypothetical protein